MKNITNKTIYKKVLALQQDMNQIKKLFFEEPPTLHSFIIKMKDIDAEKSIRIEDFGKRYGLR
jgi:hypothetical protein